MDYTIRRCDISDLDACVEAYIRTMSAPPWCERWETATAKRYLGDFLSHARAVDIAAVTPGGRVIGAVLGYEKSWCSGEEVYIEEFFVVPEYQSRGIGSELMQALENYINQRGIGSIVLMTSRDVPAMQFYKKHGFSVNDNMVLLTKDILYL